MSKLDELYRWYPVYTHPRSEKKTADSLIKRGIQVYLPLQKTLKQWSDRKKWVEEPLFKSYLFVHISNKEYDQVIQTYGVVRFIYFSRQIASIPDKQIQMLQNYLSGQADPEITFEQLEKGQKVKIISGKLKGYEAELISWKQQQRVILRLDALGQSLILKISAADVIPVFD
ncbi:UpxY family transcription antiterminator [Pedobacter puniceum]|uniref:UpxY family transcription antiterminator n=1 Tax=Pedobacter puniceum TaxID=2666136 RepID=A0A7K0FIS5_9SPHI|nr:UpxY family transcription antiterminator [Pedobacter puniceum]MRX45702.1 UpxY family transcription antiterminator [Pedobacter puniceum]